MAEVTAGNVASGAIGTLVVKMAWTGWVLGQTPALTDTDFAILGLGLATAAAWAAGRARVWAERAHQLRVAKALQKAGVDPAAVEWVEPATPERAP